jgi:hypothetical protein
MIDGAKRGRQNTEGGWRAGRCLVGSEGGSANPDVSVGHARHGMQERTDAATARG